ncbi:MAG: sn-glycerol-3-phosphate ABC transporter ATP-binding protein UgpC [Candidatus Cloacimonadales bacterium]|nr:sn-glycerol-3-phosphate ABC transporter ATP-binding protein UgpC [Candidatus Cloacimonadales bacterium]
MAKVTVKKIDKIFENGFQAVKDVSFIAEDKEFVILVGPSGCGKTTMLRMIAGLETITKGEIIIDDKIVNDVLPKDRDIAMVFQNYALYPHMTVYDNMAFALQLRRFPKAEIDRIVKESAALLEIEQLLDRKPKQLSGGQRQRVALGRAIVRDPKVFLFDEPLSNLDAKLRVQMRAEIIKLHKKLDTTIIYVTHDQVEAMTMADKMVVMKDGIIHQIDSPLKIYNNPVNLFVAGFVGSPSINQVKGTILKTNGKYFFTEGMFEVEIPNAENLAKYVNKKIIMGIRPEDIYDAEFDQMAEFPQKIKALCEVVEPMGNEFIVFLKTENAKFTARFDPKKFPKIDERIQITLDMKKALFFDMESEIKI